MEEEFRYSEGPESFPVIHQGLFDHSDSLTKGFGTPPLDNRCSYLKVLCENILLPERKLLGHLFSFARKCTPLSWCDVDLHPPGKYYCWWLPASCQLG